MVTLVIKLACIFNEQDYKNNITFFGGDMLKMGFIGTGKVGIALGRYFRHNGFEISAYFNRSYIDITQYGFEKKQFLNSIKDVVNSSDIIFITVTDTAISDIWDSVKELSIKNKVICHCSGCLTSDIFLGIEKLNAFPCTLHPILAIDNRNISIEKLSKAFFTIEGSKYARNMIREIIEKCGNKYSFIDACDKIKYHAAACFVSNLVVAINKIGVDIFKQCGFSQSNSKYAVNTLMFENIKNVYENGIIDALTGPVERNDIITIEKHLNCLNESDELIYRLLSYKLIEISQIKNKNQDYTALKSLLKTKVQRKENTIL